MLTEFLFLATHTYDIQLAKHSTYYRKQLVNVVFLKMNQLICNRNRMIWRLSIAFSVVARGLCEITESLDILDVA